MHSINLEELNLRTDLLIDQNIKKNIHKKQTSENYEIITSNLNNNNYTTITFKDITDKDNYKEILKIFINELKKYLKVTKDDIFLVIGLGNDKSTPDSLGPQTINNILVTRYLYLLGDVEEGYSNVCSFIPNVTGNTGIETQNIIKSIITETKANKVVIIDALKTNNLNRLTKAIQITDSGIHPGSGMNNTRKEISKKTTNSEIIAIGIPTVVDIKTILKDYKINNVKENLMVTPTNIDFLIEKFALLLGEGLNISLHKNYIRQINQ